MFSPMGSIGMFVFLTLVVVLSVFFLFLAAGLLTWLWNMTMPQIFGIRLITYWQAFRLILICTLLTGPLLIAAGL